MRRFLAFASILSIAFAGAIIAWFHTDENHVIGRVANIIPLQQSNLEVVELRWVGKTSVLVLETLDSNDLRLRSGRWLIACGVHDMIEGQAVLRTGAGQMRIAPELPPPPLPLVKEAVEGLPDSGHFSVLLGTAVLLLGYLLVRIVVGLSLGVIVACSSWLVLTTGDLYELWQVPTAGIPLCTIASSAFATGLVAGLLPTSGVALFSERFLLVVGTLWLAPEMSQVFEVPEGIVIVIGLSTGLLSTPAAIACFAAWLLSMGLNATGLGAMLVLAVCLSLVAFVYGPRWVWTRRELLTGTKESGIGILPLTRLIRAA